MKRQDAGDQSGSVRLPGPSGFRRLAWSNLAAQCAEQIGLAAAPIARLAGPLSPADRVAFRRAAEDAIASVPCRGEGAVYRAVAALQQTFFDPPSFSCARWDIEQEPRPTKLKNGPPIERDARADRRRGR